MVLSSLLVLGAFLTGCGSKLPYSVTEPAQKARPRPDKPVAPLEGVFLTTDEVAVDLSAHGERPVVLIFAQDTCSTCVEEARLIRDFLTVKDASPSEIHLFTVLVGAYAEDAVAWKRAHKIGWIVGRDEDSQLFRLYCEERTVPCTLVFIPGVGIVFSKSGRVEVSELVRLTGPWER